MKKVIQLGFICGLLACASEPQNAPQPQALDLPELPDSPTANQMPRGDIRPARELAIALVGEVRGEIEPCGCPTLPYGGFERRQILLDEKRSQSTLFHFDAGELLLKGLLTARSENRQERARLLLNLSTEVGVDLWVPGPTDVLALGEQKLKALPTGNHGIQAQIPDAISANLQNANGALFLPASRVIERDGIRLGIIGVSDTPSGSKTEAFVQTRDPVAAAQEALGALPDDLDLVIALGSVHDEAADRLATQVDGLGLVLTTRGSSLDPPRSPTRPDGSTGALIVETPERGRYLQMIRLRLATTADQPVVQTPQKQLWRDLLTARKQANNQPPKDNSAPQSERLHALEQEMAELGDGLNLASVSTVPLGEDLDGASSVTRQLDAFKDQARTSAKQRAEHQKTPTEPGYASSARCVNCHTSEFARWSFSGHARAWEVLLHANEADNPECVACHSTGYGQPGGLGELTPSNVRRLKAVQCESCHGPMRGHPDDPRVKPLPITEARCMTCHDEANSPEFDFETAVVKAACQGGAPVLPTANPTPHEKHMQEPSKVE